MTITPFIATAEVISLLGATPVFVDIDPSTYNIDPGKFKMAVLALAAHDPSIYPLPANQNNLTGKMVIPVDLFGLPADYDPICKLAEDNNLFVLEDAAQGLGGEYKGRPAGSLGNAAATSFFPAKPLGCYGDGGAVLTNDNDLADLIKSIRVHGKGINKYDNIRIGLNARLHTLQAAILLAKLEIFQQELDLRNKFAGEYTDRFACSNINLLLPNIDKDYRSAWAQYSVLASDFEERKELQEKAQKADIPTMIYYPTPLHLQAAFSGLGYDKDDFPVSVKIAQQIFSLPMHPYLSSEDIQKIVSVFCDH